MATWIYITIGLVVFYAILLLIEKLSKKGAKARGTDYRKRESTTGNNNGNNGANINGTRYDANN